MLLRSLKAGDTKDEMKPGAVLEKVLGHVGNTPQDPLRRHLFRFVLQASDLAFAVFLPVIHPVQPTKVAISLQSCLVCMPKSTFHGDTRILNAKDTRAAPFSGLRRGLAVFPEQEKLLCLGAP